MLDLDGLLTPGESQQNKKSKTVSQTVSQTVSEVSQSVYLRTHAMGCGDVRSIINRHSVTRHWKQWSVSAALETRLDLGANPCLAGRTVPH